MPQKKKNNRRWFLKKAMGTAAGAIAFPYVVPASAVGKSGSIAPSNRIVMGCIGTGKQGQYVLGNFLQLPEAQVVALCDCRKSERDDALAVVKKHYGKADCALYNDFRELCARTDIDAVLIASTDTGTCCMRWKRPEQAKTCIWRSRWE